MRLQLDFTQDGDWQYSHVRYIIGLMQIPGKSVGERRETSSRTRLALAAAIAFFLFGSGWAFVSPSGSSADDDYHLTSIWCSSGSADLCTTDGESPGVFVSRQVAFPACYVDWPATQSAACVNNLADDWVYTERVNSLYGHNPGGFYEVMSNFASTNVTQSVQVIRLVNVAIGALLLGWVLALAPFAVSRALVLSWGLVLTPIGIFFVASTNPSSWTILGVGSSWAFFLALLTGPRELLRVLALSLGLVVSSSLALLSRGDAGLYLIISFLSVFLLAWGQSSWRSPYAYQLRTKILLASLMLAGLGALVALSVNYVTRYVYGGGELPSSQPATDQPNPLLKTMTELPAFIVGLVGGQEPEYILSDSGANQVREGYRPSGFIFGLGWAEHQLPSLVGILVAITTFALVFTAMRAWRVTQWFAAVLVVLGIATTILFNRMSDAFAGSNLMQPRYLIPLLVVAVGVMLVSAPGGDRLISRSQATVATIFVTIGGTIAWLATAARYAIGPEAAWTNFGQQVQWWWSFGPSRLVGGAMMLFITAVWIGFALLGWGARREEGRAVQFDAGRSDPGT